MTTDGSRCSGHCCRRFFLPLTPDEIAQRVEWSKAHRETGEHPEPIPEGYAIVNDIEQIGAMIELVEWDKDDQGRPSPRYRCRHLVENDCSIYVDRPRMCSAYPFDGPKKACTFPGCTWGMARPLSPHAELLIELGGPVELVKADEFETVAA